MTGKFSAMDQKHLQDQLTVLRKELERERAARKQAEAASESKSMMVATVAHELRTPLGAIISLGDLLQTTALDRTQRHYCETLQHSARGLLSVLNDILDMAKLRAGRMELNREKIDLDRFLGSIETILIARAHDKGLKTEVVRAPDLPRWIHIDQPRLSQIIANLTDNAVKFTARGSVTLKVGYSHGKNGQGRLRIEVADTGIGMTAKAKARLFEPYVQADETIQSKHGGTGLGLSIVRDLVELMGGTIDCDGAPGEGARFWFEIPCKAGDEPMQAAPGPVAGDPKPPARRGKSRHLLVIEDNKINQTLIGVFLEKFGMSYRMIGRGEEAIDVLREEKFDAILMDIRMAGIDGLETTKRIRAMGGPHKGIPIIALTAYAMDGDAERFLAAGMNGYVTKPIEPRELLAAIEGVMAGQRAVNS